MVRNSFNNPDDLKSLRERLRKWHDKAKQYDTDLWIQFMIYWMIFDGYLSHEYHSDKDYEKRERFYKDNNGMKKIVQDCLLLPEYQKHVENLKNECPVHYFCRGELKEETIKDNTCIREIFNVIYRIRCTLFHGAKTPDSPRENNLVSESLNILRLPISKWLSQ